MRMLLYAAGVCTHTHACMHARARAHMHAGMNANTTFGQPIVPHSLCTRPT